MSAPPYMPLYVADYLGDTRHLSTEQHGAYLLLLMAMWRAGGRLPNEAAKLARIAGLSPARWAKLEADVLELFDVRDDQIGHKRIEKEFEKYTRTRTKRSESGSLGGKAKALKNKETTLASAKPLPEQKVAISEPEPEPEDSSLRSESLGADAPQPDPDLSDDGYGDDDLDGGGLPVFAGKSKRRRRERTSRCPADWSPLPKHAVLAEELGLDPRQARLEEDQFRDHEFKTPKSDWDAAFSNWLRRTAEKRSNFNVQRSNNQGRQPTAREERLGRSLAGLMAAVDERERDVG